MSADEFACRYEIAWVGRCGKIIADEHHRCAQHAGKECCVCKGPAISECSHAGQFVCGAPLCADCEGYTDKGPSGVWGFMNHRHRVKPRVVAERIAKGGREAVAADFGMPAAHQHLKETPRHDP